MSCKIEATVVNNRCEDRVMETHMLLPLPKPGLLGLDLLRESLPQLLFLLFKLGIIQLLNLGLAKFASLHLLLAVVFVVRVLGRRDQIQHVGANEKGTKFAEIAVIVVFHCTKGSAAGRKDESGFGTFGDTPKIFTTLDDPTIRGLDILG
jgi:hypothetical protein